MNQASEPLPSVTYLNKPSFPGVPSKELYHLRRLRWMVPFTIPTTHELVVKVNGEEVEDFHYYSSVVTLKNQPNDNDEIHITIKEKEEDESNT